LPLDIAGFAGVGRLEIAVGTRGHDQQATPERIPRLLHDLHNGLGVRIVRVYEDGDGGGFGRQLVDQLKLFGSSRELKKLTPVALPPGWLRLARSPDSTGSRLVVKTIGIVAVAALAAFAT
jgi:hypothetical protein